MGQIDIPALFRRYSEVEKEINYSRRVRLEEANKLATVLNRISEDTIQILAVYTPDIVAISKFSAEDILANKHDEVARVQNMYNTLLALLDSRIKFYEDAL